MIPEGLQYQSIESIVDKVVDLGLNVVRLTFAIEMVDDIYANGKDVRIKDAFVEALGSQNGTLVFEQVLQNNPQFSENTTRLQVYDAIADELATRNIYLHLDNHDSKGQWCCSHNDGNAWFNDTYFDVDNWMRGLSYMAQHGKTNWPTFSSIGLRNELRQPTDGGYPYSYTWITWTHNMTSAAQAVHEANKDILIFFSGLNFDTDLNQIVYNGVVDYVGTTFNVTMYDYYHKMVFELHTYAGVSSCSSFWSSLYSAGFGTLNPFDTSIRNRLPLILTEWGHDQGDSSGAYSGLYHTCLHSFASEWKFGWMLWTISGSYYIRSGVQDSEDTWGILNKNWTNYRGADSSAALKQMAADTFNSAGDYGVHFTNAQVNQFKNYTSPTN
ncbi:glycoside hydrolase superfamily [Lipomyces doorenjongii]